MVTHHIVFCNTKFGSNPQVVLGLATITCSTHTESSLKRRVGELEREGVQKFSRRSGGEGEMRRIIRERDQLKEATSQMENELIQVESHFFWS